MIEPCCIDNQLPEAVREQKGRAIVATSGDVLINHWYKAIGYQAGTTHKLRLCIHRADIKLLRHIRLWMQRGWTTEVQITTIADQAELILSELGEISPQGRNDKHDVMSSEVETSRVSIATDELMQSELMAMEGEDGLVMIIGPILSEKRPGATLYTVYSKRDYSAVGEVLKVVDSRHKAHRITNANINNDCITNAAELKEQNNKAYELDKENQGKEGAEAQVEGAEPDGKRVRNNRKAGSGRNGALGGKKQKDVRGAATGTADDAQG